MSPWAIDHYRMSASEDPRPPTEDPVYLATRVTAASLVLEWAMCRRLLGERAAVWEVEIPVCLRSSALPPLVAVSTMAHTPQWTPTEVGRRRMTTVCLERGAEPTSAPLNSPSKKTSTSRHLVRDDMQATATNPTKMATIGGQVVMIKATVYPV